LFFSAIGQDDTNKWFRNDTTYPSVWKHYKDNGYATGFGEDTGPYPPFAHAAYMHPIHHYVGEGAGYLTIQASKDDSKCVRNKTPVSKVQKNFDNLMNCICLSLVWKFQYQLDLIRSFWATYTDVPKFYLSWLGTDTHFLPKEEYFSDIPVKEMLSEMFERGDLDDTFLIFMGDHGQQ
jgi:hypothetical protein